MNRSTTPRQPRAKGDQLAEPTKAARLGAAIRALREQRGISAGSLAKQAGLSRSYLNYLETGKFAEVLCGGGTTGTPPP